MDKSIVLLEDKQIFGLNKVHKNVLKPNTDVYKVKSKVYYDPSNTTDLDSIKINSKLLEFVTDGLEFDSQVVKDKAAYALPYTPRYVKEIYENKTDLGNNFKIDPNKYKTHKPTQLKLKTSIKVNSKSSDELNNHLDTNLAIEFNSNDESQQVKYKFKPKSLFINENLQETKRSRSLDSSLNENENFFITETSYDIDETSSIAPKPKQSFYNKSSNLIKKVVEVNWDDQLIDSLSENTARWLVMKKINDPHQRQRLNELVEQKFGKYTRDIKYLDLVEDSLTDFEKAKIEEEKKRILAIKSNKSSIKENPEIDEECEEKTPLYRLPQGLKRHELEKMKKPDSSYNKTARDIRLNPSRIKSAIGYQEKMKEKNISNKHLFETENQYQVEMICNNKSKHVTSENENLILLENGKSFKKEVQQVYPAEFTAWISGIDLKPSDRPDMKKPVRGKKKWKKLPSLVDTDIINKPSELIETTNYWHLMPTTPDTELRKVLKSNLTVAKIIEEWRSKWQITNKWSLAEIDELIDDMQNKEANVRFQAVVVCSRAAEQIQLMIDKLEKFERRLASSKRSSIASLEANDGDEESQKENDLFNERKSLLRESNFKSKYKFSTKSSTSSASTHLNLQKQKETYQHFYDIFFPDKLFQSIESLLNDSNSKVKLGAAIAIFTILRKFHRPYLEKFQLRKDRAQQVLFDFINKSFNQMDKFAAAKCLASDLICQRDIIQILLYNYFNSDEQATKEQITKLLANLSQLNPDIISDMVEVYLKSEQNHERILACKLYPYLKSSLKNSVTEKLIDLMWNDINKSVKKVAAQTLGRTGKGRQVYDEIYNRLISHNVTDKLEALNKINHIGIMTPKILNVYVRCFRDDYISVRELACKSSQFLNEKHDKVIDSLVFMARFDRVNKLKALAIRTIGLVGDFNNEIRKCLIWALQFEIDPFIRTEACHCILLLIKSKQKNNDQELIDILFERYLIEEVDMVRQEIMFVLEYLGFDSNIELPEVNKIKEQIKKLNNKNEIINRIKELEKEMNFNDDKERFIWNEEKDAVEEEKESDKTATTNLTFIPKALRKKNLTNSFELIEKYIEKVNKHELNDLNDENYKNFKRQKSKSDFFLSKLVSSGSIEEEVNSTGEQIIKAKSSIQNKEKSPSEDQEFTNNNKKSNTTIANNSSNSLQKMIDVILEEPE